MFRKYPCSSIFKVLGKHMNHIKKESDVYNITILVLGMSKGYIQGAFQGTQNV